MARAPKGKYLYGNVIAVACFGIQAVGIGTYFSYGVLFNPLIDEFGWSRASISGAASIAFLLMGFLGIGVGRLNDRFGPRVLMTLSGVFYGLGYFLMSGLEAVWQLYFFLYDYFRHRPEYRRYYSADHHRTLVCEKKRNCNRNREGRHRCRADDHPLSGQHPHHSLRLAQLLCHHRCGSVDHTGCHRTTAEKGPGPDGSFARLECVRLNRPVGFGN